MSEVHPETVTAKPGATDLTGRDRLLRNLVSGWVAHVLQIVSGFILPRLISDKLGQGSLGVWDFGWAVVSYFSLLQGGIVSSVNRYVARHRAANNVHDLNIAVNSVSLVLKAIASIIAILSCLAAWFVPALMSEKLGGLVSEASWVVLLLGLTIAAQVQGAVYGGVLTGCHNWAAQNAIKTGAAIFSVVGGVTAIALGGGIEFLAGVMLIAELGLRSAQRVMTRKVCPELEVSRRFFRKDTAIEMVKFGGKSYLNVISSMLVNQTASVLVASTMGVAALAVFARPRALVRSISTVIHNNALVVVPMISALEAEGKRKETTNLAIQATRYAAFACLPAMIILLFLGGDVMALWMGPSYVNHALIAIFTIAGLTEAISYPLYRTLMGINRHGRFAIMNLVAAVISVALACVAAFVFNLGLPHIAAAIAIPGLVVNAVLLPKYAAQVLEIRFGVLIREAWGLPVLCCIPFAVCIIISALAISGPPWERLLIGLGSAGLASGWLFWRHAVPAKIKLKCQKLLNRFGLGSRANVGAEFSK